MAYTAQDVFDTAMGLMDEVKEDGGTDSQDNKEYKRRSLFILNSLSGELFPYSAAFGPELEGKRPACPVIEDLQQELGLDDYICRSLLPYGLAAHLLLDENPSAAGFFQQRYEELRRGLSQGLFTQSEDIRDIYGSLGHGEFSCW